MSAIASTAFMEGLHVGVQPRGCMSEPVLGSFGFQIRSKNKKMWVVGLELIIPPHEQRCKLAVIIASNSWS